MNDLSLERDGAKRFRGLASDRLSALEPLFTEGLRAGRRLKSTDELVEIVGERSPISRQVAERLGASARVVRAIAFDKRLGDNWSLGWHQDRTICVKARPEITGFRAWGRKQGLWHVQPPFSIIANMITARIHLDPVDARNAPLRIALGSHRMGPVEDRNATKRATELPEFQCCADAGDVWLYATPILHASARASGHGRRVLQLDFAAVDLPSPLEWLYDDRPVRSQSKVKPSASAAAMT